MSIWGSLYYSIFVLENVNEWGGLGTALRSLWDLSFPTRDRTQALAVKCPVLTIGLP